MRSSRSCPWSGCRSGGSSPAASSSRRSSRGRASVSSRSMRSSRRITRSCRGSSCSPPAPTSSRICSWTSPMASSTPRSERPPDIPRAAVVSAVVADRKRLPALPRSAGPYRRAWWRLRKDRLAMLSGAVLILMALGAYVVPLLITLDPYQQSLRDSLLPPGTGGHVLGTDNDGNDVLLRPSHGGSAYAAL